MKYLFLLLMATGCVSNNNAHVVHTVSGNTGVDATCNVNVKECYKLIQVACQSDYKVLFIEYTSMLEYTVTASCYKL